MIFCPKIIECQPYPAGKKQKHGHDDFPNSRDVFFEYIHDRQDGNTIPTIQIIVPIIYE